MTVKPDKTKSDEKLLTNIVENFRKITKQPAQFLCELPETKCKNIRDLLQQTYKVAVSNDKQNANNINIMPELVVEDMDEEQIWQQLELRNDEILKQLTEKVPRILNMPENDFEIRLNEEDEDEDVAEDEMGEEEEEDDEDDDNDDEEGAEFGKERKTNKFGKNRKSIVDDKFFKLSEMERFLEEEDAKEMRKSSGKMRADDETGIDFFDENETDSDEEEGNITYKDFFASDGEQEEEAEDSKQKDYFAADNVEEDENEQEDEENEAENEEEEDAELEEEENEKVNKDNDHIEPATDSDSDEEQPIEKEKSGFEMRQERLQARIRDYEEEVLGEKPWQLKGEIVATKRPQNSLLEEVLEFESTTRPAPVITEETTRRLEDIIRQRIKDQAWDDVEQKVRPQLTQQEFRKQLVLDQEKSKQSLAQIYESEYQKEVSKLNPNQDEKTEENHAHTVIKRMMHDLFIKLDALSNFHFVPKPVAPEAKIITNTPAINMEEVAPIAMTDANLLAPEEVFRHAKKQIMGKSERTRTDKNRERRNKKQKQRAINKAVEAKDLRKQKLGIPLSKKEETSKALKAITKHRNVEKVTANNDKSALKSSKAFFTQLQDQTTSNAKLGNKKRKQPNEERKKGLTAKKLKL